VDAGGHALRVRAPAGATSRFVCVHGLADTLEIWERIEPGLARRGGAALYDQRGHGASEAPAGPCTREDLARDLLAVLDALGIERSIAIGHSLGGIVAMSAALLRPERFEGLVLLGTASRCNERTARWYERIAGAAEREGLAGLARVIYGRDSRREIRGDSAGLASVTRALTSLWTDPLTPKLAEIRCPVLLVVGENDPMGARASEIAAAELPDATLRVLPGLGHWTHVEAPGPVLSAIDAWIPERRTS
jgi:3-oxoadipate enol-lactonase